MRINITSNTRDVDALMLDAAQSDPIHRHQPGYDLVNVAVLPCDLPAAS